MAAFDSMSRTPVATTVIKVGGGLSRIPLALGRVGAAVRKVAQDWPVVVVPGGGPFADAVRAFDRTVGLSDEAAHWMAILAMDQYAHVLASHIPEARLVFEPGCIREGLQQTNCVVLAPSRWLRSADVLPHCWEVTGDSIAAFVAGALDARQLILIKPHSSMAQPVDPYFSTTLPAGLPYAIVGYDQIDDLQAAISSKNAAVEGPVR
jgi:5-(aminomethyl)-3-furanmethanol phosphate kinase